jgi:predicted metal-dependent hydrolase
MYPDKFLIGVRLFNQGDYFEAHEVWEAHWKDTPGREREFFQGLIQVAVALCHFYNGNVRGARKLYGTSLAHLATFRPEYLGIDLEDWISNLDRCFAPLTSADPFNPIGLDQESVPAIVLDPEPALWPEIPAWVYEHEEESRFDRSV